MWETRRAVILVLAAVLGVGERVRVMAVSCGVVVRRRAARV